MSFKIKKRKGAAAYFVLQRLGMNQMRHQAKSIQRDGFRYPFIAR